MLEELYVVILFSGCQAPTRWNIQRNQYTGCLGRHHSSQLASGEGDTNTSCIIPIIPRGLTADTVIFLFQHWAKQAQSRRIACPAGLARLDGDRMKPHTCGHHIPWCQKSLGQDHCMSGTCWRCGWTSLERGSRNHVGFDACSRARRGVMV